jgi:hypothetical protein
MLRKSNNSLRFNTHSILNPSSGFVLDFYCSVQEMTDMNFVYGHGNRVTLGSTSPLRRALSTMQNPIPQIIHQTSPATERIWVLRSTCVRSRKASISMEVRILRRVEAGPGINVWRIAATTGIGVHLVWRILHEQSLSHTISSEYKPSPLRTSALQG